MSVAYGGPPGGAGFQPAGRVNFGWIGESFELFKANAGIWIVATLLAFVPAIVGAIIGFADGLSRTGQNAPASPAPGTNPFTAAALGGGLPLPLSIAIQILSIAYSAWLSGGVYGTAVKQVRGEAVTMSDLFSGGPIMLRMLGFNIIYGLATGFGTLFCILPGLLLSGLLFPGYALVADGNSVGDAISRSWDGMKKDLWSAAGFVFVMGLVVLAGALACGLGLFVTLPMFYLVAALAYRDMIGMPGLSSGTPNYGSPSGAAPGVWPPAPNSAPPSVAPPPQWGTTAENPPGDPGQTPRN